MAVTAAREPHPSCTPRAGTAHHAHAPTVARPLRPSRPMFSTSTSPGCPGTSFGRWRVSSSAPATCWSARQLRWRRPRRQGSPRCGRQANILPAAVMHLGAARALARPAVGRWLVVFASTSTTAGVSSAHPPCRRPRASRLGSLSPALAACWWQRPSRSAAPPTCTSALAGWWWPSCCASFHWALRCSRWWRCCRA